MEEKNLNNNARSSEKMSLKYQGTQWSLSKKSKTYIHNTI